MLFGRDETELEKLEKFMLFAQEKNIKLKPNKFFISHEVKFSGSIVTVERVQNKELIFIQPKGKRNKAFEELKNPTCKRTARYMQE